MATTEERLAALEAKMAQLTATTPTTYYTHQYSGEEIDAAVGRAATGGALDTSVTNVSNQLGTFVRPNLLDNWYFGRPVNQRGKAEHTGTQNGYFVDRWKLGAYDQTVTITDNGLRWSTTTGIWCTQIIENFDELIGRTLTLSAIIDGVLYSVTGVLNESSGMSMQPVNKLYVELTHGEKGFRFVTYNSPTPTVTILAAKLELGSTQTLAHLEGDKWILNEVPDYGEQLRRCQRYFQTFATESLRPTNALDFRPVMRVTPALSTITVGGKTLYTASADL